MSRWVYWIATGFGAGKSPIAPGTAGSLVGLVLVWLLRPVSPFIYIALTALVLGLGWYCAEKVEAAEGVKDSPKIVIDEIAGMMVSAFLLPPQLAYLVGAFFLFRILDILKPFPARWLERNLSGGAGVMLDDIAAGIYANLILQGISRGLM